MMSTSTTTMIFHSSVKGHVLEYLHNIYMHAINREENYVFVLPEEFNSRKANLEWPEAKNISFRFITADEEKKCNILNVYKAGLAQSRCIRKYAKELNADNVFLIFLIRPMPFLPFFLPRGTKASGIIYSIPLYKTGRSKMKKIMDWFMYYLFARKKNIKNIFILNDHRSAEVYNRKYNTDKFQHLTDPIPEIDMSQVKDMREELGIPAGNTVYLQIGSLEGRKNTKKILQTLDSMSPTEVSDKTFIFMGRLHESALEVFNKLKTENKVQIIVKEGFVPYEYLNSMFYTTDIVLTLYSNVEMSSGSIGYAAYFGKPVIGPSKGLLGNLIKDNNLGYAVDEITLEKIREAFLMKITPKENDYVITHTVKDFCEKIFKIF